MPLRGCLEDISALVPGGVRSVLGAPVPIYEWDFRKNTNPLTDIRSGVAATLTRASDGTYVDAGGIIQMASSNEARFTFDPSDGTPLGLLVEGARTNLMLHSEDLSDTVWSAGSGETITADDETAPDGNVTADLVTLAGTSDEVQQNATMTANADKAFSAFYRYVDNQWVQSSAQENGGAFERVNSPADILNGAVSAQFVTNAAPPTARGNRIDEFSNSWYRHSHSVTSANSITSLGHKNRATVNDTAETGVAGAEFHMWGGQVEDNTRVPTSYIPTEASSVTRAADVCSATVSGIDEGTIVIEGRVSLLLQGSGNHDIIQIDDGDSSDRIVIYHNSAGTLFARSDDASAQQANVNVGTISANGDFKVAMSWADNDVRAALNGSSGTPDTSGSAPDGLSTIRFGHNHTPASHWNGTIKSVKIFNRTFSDSQLRDLTQ